MMTPTRTPERIADLLQQIQHGISTRDNIASAALHQSVSLLKAALPFQLPIPILTGHVPPTAIGLEDSHEPYAGILVRWYSELASRPTHSINVVADVIVVIRGAVDAWLWNLPDGEHSTSQPLRKRKHAVSDLTDATMTNWLSAITLEQLSALATRWDSSGRANNKPGVLEELGLTARSMLDLPDAELRRLKLLERFEAEERERSAELWRFLQADDIGRKIERLTAEAAAAFVATHGKP